MSIRNFFQKHLKIYLFLTFGQQYVYMLFLMFSVCCVFFSDRFDSHDERDDDGEGESVEEHKSVIMHLLSQVRLGMDLTKVNTNNLLLFFTFSPIFFIQFPPFNPSLSSSGRLADIYLGAQVVAGNVCRFLCTPRFVCKVMHILSFYRSHSCSTIWTSHSYVWLQQHCNNWWI